MGQLEKYLTFLYFLFSFVWCIERMRDEAAQVSVAFVSLPNIKYCLSPPECLLLNNSQLQILTAVEPAS